MRATLLIVFSAGCAAASISTPPAPGTVRQRLAMPSRLVAGSAAAAGSITASRYGTSGWQSGSADLALDQAALTGAVDDAGALELSDGAIELSPIELPVSVFGEPAELRDVKLSLAAPATIPMTWTDDDDATAEPTQLALNVDWSIFIHGSAVMLGTQHLAPLPVTVTITGDGDDVDVELAVRGDGELWSWADLVKVTALSLDVSAHAP